MALFTCDTCNTVDSDELTPLPNPCPSGKYLCTECLGGTWHNQFPRAVYDPKVDHVVNRPSGIGLG